MQAPMRLLSPHSIAGSSSSETTRFAAFCELCISGGQVRPASSGTSTPRSTCPSRSSQCTGCIVRRNLAVTTGGTTANGSTSSGLATNSLDRKGVARAEKAKAVVVE